MKNLHYSSSTIATWLATFAVWLCSNSFAEGRTFAIVAKSVDDGNFVDVWTGCDLQAQQYGDRCELIGGHGQAHLRAQEKSISEAVASQKFDGFAISVINSDRTAQALTGNKVPVITFDSPFDQQHQSISQAYVGTNNIQFGRDLALLAKGLNPNAKRLCLMSAIHDENLQQRILGVRRYLSGDASYPSGRRLNGENGWQECERSPWQADDNIDRALAQIQHSFTVSKPDVFISVGHWPIIDEQKFRQAMEPFSKELRQKERTIIVGIGSQSVLSAERLMNDGLIHGFVVIDFQEIGRYTYHVLQQIIEGEYVDETTYVPNILRAGD